jgi:hypothetical protein
VATGEAGGQVVQWVVQEQLEQQELLQQPVPVRVLVTQMLGRCLDQAKTSWPAPLPLMLELLQHACLLSLPQVLRLPPQQEQRTGTLQCC